jgi:nucleoside 2-deoxyribosyltransferase
MKLYIAAANQEDARGVAAMCRAAGHTITSQWLDEVFKPTADYTESERKDIAIVDANDVSAADALVLLASPKRIPGGKFVEAGIALGESKPVFILGHRENMLLWHPLCRRFDSAEDMLKELR